MHVEAYLRGSDGLLRGIAENVLARSWQESLPVAILPPRVGCMNPYAPVSA
jgi:hypothetical protein